MVCQFFHGQEVQTNRNLDMDSVVVENHLFIQSTRNGSEMYDLLADPANQHNLAGRSENRSRQERLKGELEAPHRRPIGALL